MELAVKRAQQRGAKLVAAVKGAGVEEKHLQIDNMTVELRYRNNNRPVADLEGFVTRLY